MAHEVAFYVEERLVAYLPFTPYDEEAKKIYLSFVHNVPKEDVKIIYSKID